MRRRETFEERNARHHRMIMLEAIKYIPLIIMIVLFLIGSRI